MDVEALSRGTEVGHLERPRVAVDAMGGDHAPEEVVRGAVDWARLHKDVEVILVGDEARMRPFIDEPLPSHVRIVQASETVGMDEQPAVAVRRKRDASINVAMRLVRDGEADAVVTAGHTGAGVASAILHLKRLPGVDRPALAVQMITDSGPLILLDIGATTDSTGINLAQYAHMGSLFSERVLGVTEPTVALLSIGEESGKGEQRVQDATALLKDSHLRFIGNVEGRDVPAPPRRRRRLRRLRRQRRHEVLRGPLDGHVRHAAQASSSGRPGVPSATSSCARASAASGHASTTRSWAARPCWASTAPCSSPMAAPGAA